MSEISDKLEYKSIAIKIKKGEAKRRDYERLNLIEARIYSVELQNKLRIKYSQELVSKINALDIRIRNMEKSWEIYRITKHF